MKSLGKRLLAGPYLIWMLLFTIVPLLLLVYNAFTTADGSFTVANVAAILDPVNGKPFLRSIGMSVIVTVICLVLSFPLALILRKYSSSKNSFIVLVFILPMWMNFMLRTLAWRLILLNNGLLNHILTSVGLGEVHLMNTIWAVILGTVYDYLPFMVLPIYNALAKIDDDVIHAAQDLGAGQMTILRRIIIPLSVPGIVSGITMVMVPSVSEFVIASMLGGGKVYLIGNVIEQAFNSGYADIHAGSGLSLSLMVLILISMVIYRIFEGEEGESSLW
ncbi:MAG: ABC transporter permease [Lachnospiraceae bacterium]|nr:ABC transporter permease [Lachnospiraceae bacterium]